MQRHRRSPNSILFPVRAAAWGALACTALAGGCRTPETPAGASTPVPTPAATATSARFREVAKEAGLSYKWEVVGKRPLNILQTIGNGCAFLDYDGDGNLDILLVGTHPALFKGDGKGKFTDVSAQTGVGKLAGHYLGCAVGDYDGDGRPDVYLSAYRGGTLLRNDGGKGFADVTAASGMKPQLWGTSCGWADLDGDGKLDLYVANYADFGPKTVPQMCKFGTESHGDVLSSCGPRYYKGIKGVAFHNLGGGKFADATQAWGMTTHTGRGLGVAFADADGDGKPSLAVTNDEAAGDLFSPSGKTFENIGAASGVAYDRDGKVHGGMGTDWGDYNNDGRLDLFVATFRNEAKSLYRNDGSRSFTDVSYPTGVGRAALPYVSFGTKFFDADNDGWLDLILASGHVQDNIKIIENTDYPQKTVFLRNENGNFADVSDASGVGALPPIVGRGLATGDYDNDGRVDVLVVDSEGSPLLLHNETSIPSGAPNWVGFACKTKTGSDALGAVLTLETDGKPGKLVRQCQTAGSYLSASDARVHFGLGQLATKIKRLTIRWPSGKTETVENIDAGHYHTLREK